MPPAPPLRAPLAPQTAVLALAGLAGLALGGAGPACEDPPAPPADDAAPGSPTLRVVGTDRFGLAYGETADLRVLLEDAAGEPIPEAEITFAIVAVPPESPGGSTLSTASAWTDGAGRAVVTVRAGASPARFRVRASSRGAADVTFEITVAENPALLATLIATPRHVGARPDREFATVAVRLYLEGACVDLAPEDPPSPLYPPRVLQGFDTPAVFSYVEAGRRHALLATGRGADGTLLAAGCLELLPAQLAPASTTRADLPIVDREPVLASAYDLTSVLDLRPVADEVATRAPAWTTARCPLGAAQLTLDAILVVLGDEAAASALAAARGELDASGCRSDTGAGGDISADAALHDALVAGGAATLPAFLPDAAADLADLLDEVGIASRLERSDGGARHRLVELSLEAGGRVHAEDAGASPRPIVEASVAVARGGTTVSLDAHTFTLRLGWLVEAAFAAQVLSSASSPATPRALGKAIVDDARDGALDGCAAVSAALCRAAELDQACAEAACVEAAAALDVALAAPFAALDAPGADLTWSGAGRGLDLDADLVLEALADGLWSAELRLADGAVLTVTGTFATPAP